jgi:hypothetical protein
MLHPLMKIPHIIQLSCPLVQEQMWCKTALQGGHLRRLQQQIQRWLLLSLKQ